MGGGQAGEAGREKTECGVCQNSLFISGLPLIYDKCQEWMGLKLDRLGRVKKDKNTSA